MTKINWKQVEQAIKDTNKGVFFIGYNDCTGKLALYCNNGWCQANNPKDAMGFLNSIVEDH